MYYVDYI